MNVPRLVVAAPCSGAGKTTVATGLMAALRARGHVVSAHKVGPDFIDPTYHAVATGRPGRNLDPFLMGEQRVAPLFAYGSRGAGVAVVEGVMGLFDGRGATDEASTAHVARLLRAPVLLVVDASGMSSSVAALVRGFATHDRQVRVAGVVLNRVASARHEQLLREALASTTVPVVGALPREPAVRVPSRHLGLVPSAERAADARRDVEALAGLVARCCDLEAVLRIAGSAPPLATAPWSPQDAVGPAVPGAPVLAVAAGPAFTFTYPETTELLTAAGAQVVAVDPLADERLPDGTAGLFVGGGFPEEHAEALSANVPLRGAVARLARSGRPVVAECAGLLLLARTLDARPMCGVLPTDARMTGRLTLGYREAVDDAGRTVRAHEFHRTVCAPAAGRRPAYVVDGARREGFRSRAVQASYLHVHWAAQPARARELAERAAA